MFLRDWNCTRNDTYEVTQRQLTKYRIPTRQISCAKRTHLRSPTDTQRVLLSIDCEWK